MSTFGRSDDVRVERHTCRTLRQVAEALQILRFLLQEVLKNDKRFPRPVCRNGRVRFVTHERLGYLRFEESARA